MKISMITLVMIGFLLTSDAYAADRPESLAAELNAAIVSKDMNAAASLVEWGAAPVQAHRMFRMSVADCFPPASCKMEIGPMSEEDKKPQSDYFFAVAPEGNLKILSSGGGDGFKMPFAKINGQYKIIIGQLTDDAYADLKASADATKIAQALDPEVMSEGKALSDTDGDPASEYRNYLSAIAKGDSTFLAQHGSAGDRYFFGKAYINNPVKAAINLELMQMESIKAPDIKGGFTKNNRAVLLVSGLNGRGWHSEGAVLLMNEAGKWSIEDINLVSYPPRN